MSRAPVWILLLIGLALIGIGAYSLLRKDNPASNNTSNQPPSTNTENSATNGRTIIVDAKVVWTNTGIQINKGDKITINSEGKISVAPEGYPAHKWVGPDGWGYIQKYAENYTYQVNNSLGCLIGKIGGGQPFYVGSRYQATAKEGGILYLGINDAISGEGKTAEELFARNLGEFRSTVTVEPNKPQAKAQSDPNDLSDTYGMTVKNQTIFNKKTKVAFATAEEFFKDSGRSHFNYKFDMVDKLPPGLRFVDGRPLTDDDYRRVNGR